MPADPNTLNEFTPTQEVHDVLVYDRRGRLLGSHWAVERLPRQFSYRGGHGDNGTSVEHKFVGWSNDSTA
ncbi:hypothetical protein [Brooklawnia sp.]|uniref:hypothetical protein n=1 Tax=Brooklawnia sp. TaxID=2699740 RepID=UPI00311D7DD5